MGKCLAGGFRDTVSVLPSGESGDVRRSAYVRTAFGVCAYSVRCMCIQRSVYVRATFGVCHRQSGKQW